PDNAARCGVEAALLAAEGYVGTRDGVAGSRAFLAGYTDDAHPGELLAGWGERPLEIMATSLKPHACCPLQPNGAGRRAQAPQAARL
ncbi:MAG: hypothetical protein GEU78_19350, partial [Actinobacteria bacterium]|nr:hypothetical protein [Actinomycetota bacterium]